MSKDLMIEIEELANQFKTNGKIYLVKILASARSIIVREMIKAGKMEIAKGYLKKQMLTKAGDQVFLNTLLKKVSKLPLDAQFLMDVIQKTVVDDINPQIFSNIFINLEF